MVGIAVGVRVVGGIVVGFAVGDMVLAQLTGFGHVTVLDGACSPAAWHLEISDSGALAPTIQHVVLLSRTSTGVTAPVGIQAVGHGFVTFQLEFLYSYLMHV